MKLVFTKKEGNRASVNNKAVFEALFVSERMFEAFKAGISFGLRKNVFDIRFDSGAKKIAYAVVPNADGENEIRRVFVVQQNDKAIKLIFEDDVNPCGVQMYIEDGDVLYTTLEEAEKAAYGENANDFTTTENTGVDEEDPFVTLLRIAKDFFAPVVDDIKDTTKKYAEKAQQKVDEVVKKQEKESEQSSTEPKPAELLEKLYQEREQLLKQNSAIMNKLKNIKKQINDLEETIGKDKQ